MFMWDVHCNLVAAEKNIDQRSNAEEKTHKLIMQYIYIAGGILIVVLMIVVSALLIRKRFSR